MNADVQLRLQALLDGELSAAEAAETDALVARDAAARALLDELRNTRAALKAHEESVRLPESREFFWSKIEREIGRQEAAEEKAAASVPVRAWWRRPFAPLAGIASLAFLLVFALTRTPDSTAAEPGTMELSSEEMGANVFRDQDQRMTVVWFYDKPGGSELTQPEPVDSVRPE